MVQIIFFSFHLEKLLIDFQPNFSLKMNFFHTSIDQPAKKLKKNLLSKSRVAHFLKSYLFRCSNFHGLLRSQITQSVNKYLSRRLIYYLLTDTPIARFINIGHKTCG